MVAGEAYALARKLLFPSPDELRTQLPNARVVSVGDVSEVRTADVPARVHELGVVENIEEFAPDLERQRFPDRNDLRYSEIGIVEARAMEESAVRRAETSAISTSQRHYPRVLVLR